MSRIPPERVLIDNIQRGDTESFSILYDHYIDRIYRFIYLKVPTMQDAEDLTGETFLKLWHYLSEKKEVEHLQAFIYKIARNAVVDFYRKRGTVQLESLDEPDVIVADRVDLSLEEKMILKSEMVVVEQAIRELKDAYRDVIVLHYLNDVPLIDVAAIIEKPFGGTRVLLHRAMKALRLKLGTPSKTQE